MGKKYVSSDSIYNRILGYEQKDPNGLNGFILLLHIGTDPARTDKFYYKLHELINELSARGSLSEDSAITECGFIFVN
jgi:hypothetical protein